ncbi:MAG: PAS domain S-box protein [Bacteriovoracia bacterium]
MERLQSQSVMTNHFQKESDERYELLIKSLETIEDYAIFTLDPHGYIQTWNHGARRIKGYFSHEVIGKHFSIFYSQEDQAKLLPQYKLQIAAERGRFEEEGYRVRKNGQKFWANVIITALKDPSGNVLSYSKVTRDLTDKKTVEQKLRQSEERFKLLLDNVKDYAICMLDLEGNITTWNTGAEEIKGYSPHEVIGKHFSLFHSEEDVQTGKVDFILETAKKSGRFEESGWRYVKNGNKIWAHVVITAVKDDQNNLIGFTKVTRDISDNKKIQELEDSIRIRDEFISVASHELRTPLTRILLNIQLMKRNGTTLNDREKKSLDVCESGTKELVSLMDNLVDVTRLRLGKLEIRRTKTNITNIVLNVITKFKDEIRFSGNHVSLTHGGDIVGYWDQSRLEQLFTNLLSNAIKFGEGRPIKMELKLQDEQVHFSIADEGQGIPFHLQSKVFERFERAVDSKKISGLGLGLYVSKQIVSAHKGEISLESQPGHGSVFKISLPLKKDPKKKSD